MESQKPKSKWKWINMRRLIERGISVSNGSETNDPELKSIVTEVQRFAYLYGEEFIESIPSHLRAKTQELFGLEEKNIKSVKISDSYDSAKERKKFRRIVGKIYRKATQELIYEEKRRHLSLSTTRVRQRLSDLMGTDVIRLNDKRYFQKLTERLQDEYETSMDKQEEARAASEEQRLRRLMLEGVIDAKDDYRAVVFGRNPKQNKKKKRRKSKKHTQNRDKDDGKASDDEGHSKSRKDEVVTQVEILNGSRPTSSKSSMSGRPDSSHGKKKVSIQEYDNDTRGHEMHARPPHHENALRTSSACSSHRKQRRVKSAAPRISHWSSKDSSSDDEEYDRDRNYDTQSLPDKDYFKRGSRFSKYSLNEPERVNKLRNEETVAGLYSIAEELISPVKTGEETTKKVQVVKQKKMAVSYS